MECMFNVECEFVECLVNDHGVCLCGSRAAGLCASHCIADPAEPEDEEGENAGN